MDDFQKWVTQEGLWLFSDSTQAELLFAVHIVKYLVAITSNNVSCANQGSILTGLETMFVCTARCFLTLLPNLYSIRCKNSGSGAYKKVRKIEMS